MSQCILCASTGKERKYFFSGKGLCDSHYIAYLEFLIKDMDEEVTSSTANSALSELKMSLEPTPKPTPKVVVSKSDDEDEDYSYGMRM